MGEVWEGRGEQGGRRESVRILWVETGREIPMHVCVGFRQRGVLFSFKVQLEQCASHPSTPQFPCWSVRQESAPARDWGGDSVEWVQVETRPDQSHVELNGTVHGGWIWHIRCPHVTHPPSDLPNMALEQYRKGCHPGPLHCTPMLRT